jgi:hypothetical protein
MIAALSLSKGSFLFLPLSSARDRGHPPEI